jgi:hypothetical protein
MMRMRTSLSIGLLLSCLLLSDAVSNDSDHEGKYRKYLVCTAPEAAAQSPHACPAPAQNEIAPWPDRRTTGTGGFGKKSAWTTNEVSAPGSRNEGQPATGVGDEVAMAAGDGDGAVVNGGVPGFEQGAVDHRATAQTSKSCVCGGPRSDGKRPERGRQLAQRTSLTARQMAYVPRMPRRKSGGEVDVG